MGILLTQIAFDVEMFVEDTPYTPDHIGYRTASNDAYADYKQQLISEGAQLAKEPIMVSGREISLLKLPHSMHGFNYLEIAQPRDDEEKYTGLEHVEYVCDDIDALHKTYSKAANDMLIVHPIKSVEGMRYFKIVKNGKEIGYRENPLMS